MNNFGEKQKHTGAAGMGKILKSLAAVALSAAMALSFAACAPNSGGTGSSVENPGTNEPTNPGTNPSTNPGTNPGTEPSNPGTDPDTDDPYAKYSPALQAVLKSNYYNKLIKQLKDGKLPTYNGYPTSINIFGQVPYKFLESEGYDIEQLKTTDINITSFTYVYEGNESELYNFVNIAYQNAENKYISQYLLKYDDISEQEYKELKMLINGRYIQTGLFVQELNNFHTPHVVSHYNIGYDAYNTILKDFSNGTPINDMLEANASAFALISVEYFNQETNIYTIGMRVFGSNTDKYSNIAKTKSLDVNFSFWDNAGATYNNQIFDTFSMSGRYSNYSDTSNISLYEFYPTSGWKNLIS